MRTFLVTGGAGFIGSHLCDALLDQGARVRVLDDLSTGSQSNLRTEVDFWLGDVADPTIVNNAMDGMDGCFHLAAIASVARSTTEWLTTHRTNLTGAIAVFDAAQSRKLPVVYASSAAVYGDCPTIPITEDADKQPLSAYGADKCGCELHAHVAAKVHGLSSVGLRFFNVYGPRQDPQSPYSGVISIFCQRIMRGEPIDIYGDGKQVRDFVFVEDVVLALQKAMTWARLRGQVMSEATVRNVCTGQPTSVIELATTIAQLADKPLEMRFGPARTGDIRISLGCPERSRGTFGLPASTSLHDGLSKLLRNLDQVR